MGGQDDWRPIAHRKQQSADREQDQKRRPARGHSRGGASGEKFRQRPTLPHGNRAVPSALEGLTARSVWEGGTTGDRSPTGNSKAPTGSRTKSDAPRRGDRATGRPGEKIPAATYSPTRKPCSTIGSGGLNCRVRDGNGWIPSDVATGKPFAYAQAMSVSVSAADGAALDPGLIDLERRRWKRRTTKPHERL